MPIRSDWSLELLLLDTKERCASDETLTSVTDVIKYINSAPRARFRGGKALVDLLRHALLTTSDNDEREILRRIADSIDYAEGRIFKNDLEEFEDLGETTRRLVTTPEALALLAGDRNGQILLQAAELRRRQAGLTALRRVVDNPDSSEADIHTALKSELWIFGGEFVGEAQQRRLTQGDEVDVPLLRPDGSLCVVELKKAMVPIIKRQLGTWVPNAEVNNAIGQAVTYLINLDENRRGVLDEFGIDTRRANAIVLIGHHAMHPDLAPRVISEALRVRNSHWNRVEVLTYPDLLDAAARSLKPATQAGTTRGMC